MEERYQLDKSKSSGSYYFSSAGLTINPGEPFPMTWSLSSDKLMLYLIKNKMVIKYKEPIVIEPVAVELVKPVEDSFVTIETKSKKNKDK